ncbi:MAG: hypothetical protein ABSG15_08705 [FCB group bacterium]|jgi:hypothetical protein
MGRLFGSKFWQAIDVAVQITEDLWRLFLTIYGDTITLVFNKNEYRTYLLKDFRNRNLNLLNLMLPENEFFTIIDLALEIFFRSGRSLSWMSGKADALEELCSRYNIVMIFVEHESKLKSQLSKVNGDMEKFLAETKPLPKRLDFRKTRKKKSIILPVFNLPNDLDRNGWPIKPETTVINDIPEKTEIVGESENGDIIAVANDNVETIITPLESYTIDSITGTVDMIEPFEPPVEPVKGDKIAKAVKSIDKIELSEEYEAIEKVLKDNSNETNAS